MKKRRFYLAFLFVFLFLFLVGQKSKTAASAKEIIALVKGTLIDGTGAPPISNAVIIIQNELITAIGSHDKTKIPDRAKIIDLQGAAILPGFINAHIHRGYIEHNLKAWAKEGVTAVRDLGGNHYKNLVFAISTVYYHF